MSHRCPVTRRMVLGGIGALTGAALCPIAHSGLVAHKKSGEDVSSSLGLQLYTLGDEPERDLEGTLTAIANIGYRAVELPRSYGLSSNQLRRVLDRADLICSSIHAAPREAPGWWDLEGDPSRIAADAHELGTSYIVMSSMLMPAWMVETLKRPPPGGFDPPRLMELAKKLTEDDWKRTAELLSERAAALEKSGIRVAYHNHAMDFLPLSNGKTGFDVLLEEIRGAPVDLELDVGWAVAAGQDIRDLFRRSGQSIRLLHLKDTSSRSSTPFELVPANVGQGIVAWKELFAHIHEHKVRHLFVEQEAPFATTPMDAVRAAYTYISGKFGSVTVS